MNVEINNTMGGYIMCIANILVVLLSANSFLGWSVALIGSIFFMINQFILFKKNIRENYNSSLRLWVMSMFKI
jgi:hypothetical protein